MLKRTTNLKRLQGWLSAHGIARDKPLRDKLIGFAVSCGVHVLLLITLSLIAIGTGAVPTPTLLIAAQVEAGDESLSSDPAWAAEAEPIEMAELPESTDARALEFSISDLEVSLPKLDRPAETSAVPQSADTTTSSAKQNTRAGARSARASGSALDAMQTLAAAGIQSRVSKAGGKQGEVQFALAWKNVNDLDLHVIPPSGEHISHQRRRSQCGGMLDVDMNVDGESEEPVENVRWLRNAPWGRYTILVNFFKLNSEGVRRPSRQSPYQLLVQLGGDSSMQEKVAGFGEQQVTVWRFIYVPDSFPSTQREQMLKHAQALQAREEELAAPMLEKALEAEGAARQRLLRSIVQHYPHTDAAIEALQSMDGEVVKRSNSQ